MSEVQTSIPKIIHYCWFGGKPLPEGLQKCVDSWSKLEGYKIMRWDESNCSFDENEFVRSTYAEKKYGFIGDYYRLKAVYEYGGIYLDTDVMVNRSFDPLLGYNVFLNFIFESSIGTAIIGARKGSPFIRSLMDMYDKTVLGETTNGKQLEWRDGKLYAGKAAPASNYYFTFFMIHNYPNLILNNKFQDMGDFVIFPKEMFEIGRLSGKHYAIHLCDGAWRKKDTTPTFKGKIKNLISGFPWLFDKVRIIVRSIRYRRINKNLPFYAYSEAQKKGRDLPEI